MTPYPECKGHRGREDVPMRCEQLPIRALKPMRNGHLSGRAVVANFTSA